MLVVYGPLGDPMILRQESTTLLWVVCLWGPLHVVLFNTIIFLLAVAHLKAVCSDPGVVPLPQSRVDFSDIHSGEAIGDCTVVNDQLPRRHVMMTARVFYVLGSQSLLQREDWTVCTRCETYRPPRAHHCRICKRCIRRMDHHCPWINNCVGEQNQKYFIQFLVYVGALSAYAIVLVVTSWLVDCPDCSNEVTVKQSRILHCVILVLESGLFGMFVSAILVDQLQAIFSDETAVEQLQKQGPYRPHKSRLALLSEVCGRVHPMMWLLPCGGVSRGRDEPLLSHYDV
uniref:Palmitoyltransferase n=1 Tax=Timema cristinae TaxID=61476 RepID=A0A7R9H054_TIMCR|nr:unnamed protein product [Timema cristinae]